MRKEPIAVSIALHISVVGSLLLLSVPRRFANPPVPEPTINVTKLLAPPVLRQAPPRPKTGTPGGGARSPLQASKGNPPRVFVAPQILPTERPQLVVPLGAEDVPKIATGPVGSPFGQGSVWSLGPGVKGYDGVGDDGKGRGPGGGSATASIEKPSRWPELLHKVEPEYSEPARKARHQGTVLLAVDIGTDGRPSNIRVVRGMGLGLDEKAVDAVSTWRFKPAQLRGRPVSAAITVEVNFRLL